MTRLAIGWLLAAAACAVLAYWAGDTGARRVETALALQCARASSGTDSAIVECFNRYGLDTPEGIK